MYGRRLATIEEIIALVSPDSEDELSTLETWADDHEIPVHAVEVGDNIDEVYTRNVSIWVSLSAVTGRTSKASGSSVRGRFRSSGLTPGPSHSSRVSPRTTSRTPSTKLFGVVRRSTAASSYTSRGNRVDCTGINDVMIEHEPPENPVDRKITELEVFADGEFVGKYEGSGLAVSTPTGSTGVSLSAGGPVHYPMNNSSLQIVPLHTHRMGTRPLIVDANTTIEVVSGGRKPPRGRWTRADPSRGGRCDHYQWSRHVGARRQHELRR